MTSGKSTKMISFWFKPSSKEKSKFLIFSTSAVPPPEIDFTSVVIKSPET